MTPQYRRVEEAPAENEYMTLHVLVRPESKVAGSRKRGLPDSRYAVYVRDDTRLIGRNIYGPEDTGPWQN